MNKHKSIIIGVFVLVTIFSIKAVHAEGGRNGECLDADIRGYTDDGDQTSYRSEEGSVIEGVCIKAGNDAFGDGHSQEITSNGEYDGCYVIEGLGTRNITVSRKNDSSCKEISHIDMYLGSKANEEKEEDPVIPIPEPEPKPERERNIENNDPVEPEETEPEIVIAAVDITEPEEETLAITTNNEDNNDDDPSTSSGSEDEDEEEEYTEDISEITELPKTGAYDFMSMIGLFLIAAGFTLKKTNFAFEYKQ